MNCHSFGTLIPILKKLASLHERVLMKKRAVQLLWVALAVFSSQSFATTTTTTFLVSTTVAATCAAAALPLAFGVYDPTSSANLDATTSVTVTCTGLTSYNVGLDAGTASGATVTTRQMSGGGNTINYSLYRNSGRTLNWGNTVGTDTVSGTGTGLPQVVTVYGRIPGSQPSVPPGAYSDTITVTVTY